MLKRENDEAPAREVSLWLEKHGILERYKNLRSHNKVVLRNLVCIPTRLTSHTERVNLYKELYLQDKDMPGRDKYLENLVPLDEELKKLFTPVAPSETLSYWQKF